MEGAGQRLGNDGVVAMSGIYGFSLIYMEESVAVERCPMCQSGKRAMYCSKCVKKAKLCESSRGFKFRSFKEGLSFLKAKAQAKRRLEQRIEELTQPLYKLDELRWNVEMKQEQLAQLREKRDSLCKRISDNRRSIAERKQLNRKQVKTITKARVKVESMSGRISGLSVRISDKQDYLADLNARIVEKRRDVIKESEKFIFSMELTQCSSVEEDIAVCENIADATSHQFVEGQWSYVHEAKRLNCVILGVTTPLSGDCTHLQRHLSDYKNMNGVKTPTISALALEEWAAVGYTSQFTHNISKILDLSLPYATNIPRLNVNAIELSDLMNYLAQLNVNLAFLASSQGLDTSTYEPSRLIQNLYQLLQYEHLGRREPFSLLTSSLLQSLECEITEVLSEEQSADRQNEEEDEWSIVTEVPSADSLVVDSINSQQSHGLVTSARNVVSSFWPF